MKKIFIYFLTLLISTSILTGCWSSREISELAIATAIGIDKTDDGYLVTVQLINPGEVASEKATNRTAVTTYRTTGETVFEALRRITLETPRKVYLSHLRLLVYGEEFAREGIGKALDIFSRDHELRTDYFILIAKDMKAEKLLNVLTPVEQIPANKMYESLEMSAKSWASTYHVQLDELINSLVSEGREPVLTGVIVKGDPNVGMDIKNLEKVDPPATVQIRYIAGFKEDKLVGWLNEYESIGYNYIMNHVSSTILSANCPTGGKLAVELIRTKAKVKGKVENGEAKIDVEVWTEGNIGDVGCKIDLSKNQSIYNLETKIEEKIEEQMESALKAAQERFKSDIFGFGEVIHRTDPKAWKKLKDDWNKEFEDLEVNFKVTARIRRLGTVINSYRKDVKE